MEEIFFKRKYAMENHYFFDLKLRDREHDHMLKNNIFAKKIICLY